MDFLITLSPLPICTHSCTKERSRERREAENTTRRREMAAVANAAVVVIAVLLMATAMELQRAEAVNYTVGDSHGWNVPSNGAITYTDWASTISFVAGDILCKWYLFIISTIICFDL